MLEGMCEANKTSITEALIGDVKGSKAVIVLQCSKKRHDRALNLAAVCAAESQLSESIPISIDIDSMIYSRKQ